MGHSDCQATPSTRGSRTVQAPPAKCSFFAAGTPKCVFRSNVTARFGIVTGEFGNVTGHFGDVTEAGFGLTQSAI